MTGSRRREQAPGASVIIRGSQNIADSRWMEAGVDEPVVSQRTKPTASSAPFPCLRPGTRVVSVLRWSSRPCSPAARADRRSCHRRCRPPSICSRRRRWLARPPLRPASRASSLVHSWAVPFWCAALPPLLAISRCLARSIDANPRSSLATVIPPPVPSRVPASPRQDSFSVRASPSSATAVPRRWPETTETDWRYRLETVLGKDRARITVRR